MDDLNQLLTFNFVKHYKRLLSCGVYCQQPDTQSPVIRNIYRNQKKLSSTPGSYEEQRQYEFGGSTLFHSFCATSEFQPKTNTFFVLPQKSLEGYIPLFCKSQLSIIYSDIIPVIVIAMHQSLKSIYWQLSKGFKLSSHLHSRCFMHTRCLILWQPDE